jgi:deferrochelatase/peroxidase EfeB
VTHAFVTVAIPFDGGRAADVNARLDTHGNPARGTVAAALSAGEFVHFMNINVVHREGESGAHLVLAAAADGSARAACARLAEIIGAALLDVLQAAGLEVAPERLGAFLEKHRLNVGPGWFRTPGVLFAGTLGMSVRRIKEEAAFASWVGNWLENHRDGGSAQQRLAQVRDEVFKRADLKWAFVAEPVPLLGDKPPASAAVRPVLVSLLRSLLWPLLLLPLLAGIVSWRILGRSMVEALWDGMLVIGLELPLLAGALWIAYRWLRRREEADKPKDKEPNAAAVAEFMATENRVMQNHLAAASTLKPGRMGRLILRLVLWAVDALATYGARPGFLCDIGTIHFARWLVLPRTDALLFLSNYDDSWESYLEDFIARAHAGLSAIWSNTRDFPKTSNLIQGGASDGERFKRWARCQQILTRFWFSAYPSLTTARIRQNAAIRHGFASASTEEAAAAWLKALGYPTPPASTLERDMIPTLVFGGLPRLIHAHCLIVNLAEGRPGECRDWLRKVAEELCFGERAPDSFAAAAAFSASGLRKLGLGEAALASFPTAFQLGMAARARVLGDADDNAPERWQWGGSPDREGDAIVLLYAKDLDHLQSKVWEHGQQVSRYGHRIVHQIAMKPLPEKGQPIREPFGFIDGISQPIIRGTRKWHSPHNPIQVIEPGEIVLGYRDNLLNVAPVPVSEEFPVGFNGTFLVARQLEQYPDRLERCLADAASVIAADPRSPSKDPAWIEKWLAAKMVGRWKDDGTSLVRHPTPPGTPGRVTVENDNDFLFGAEDPDGLHCPFGAHIRRANPRDSFDPGSPVQIGITNRHRVLRVGRSYDGRSNGDGKRGLLFMCLNSDIEGQFEFLQQTWVLGRDFHGLNNERDPLVGQHQGESENTMSIPTPLGTLRIPSMRDFVAVCGGAYFFMPGKRAVEYLAGI